MEGARIDPIHKRYMNLYINRILQEIDGPTTEQDLFHNINVKLDKGFRSFLDKIFFESMRAKLRAYNPRIFEIISNEELFHNYIELNRNSNSPSIFLRPWISFH